MQFEIQFNFVFDSALGAGVTAVVEALKSLTTCGLPADTVSELLLANWDYVKGGVDVASYVSDYHAGMKVDASKVADEKIDDPAGEKKDPLAEVVNHDAGKRPVISLDSSSEEDNVQTDASPCVGASAVQKSKPTTSTDTFCFGASAVQKAKPPVAKVTSTASVPSSSPAQRPIPPIPPKPPSPAQHQGAPPNVPGSHAPEASGVHQLPRPLGRPSACTEPDAEPVGTAKRQRDDEPFEPAKKMRIPSPDQSPRSVVDSNMSLFAERRDFIIKEMSNAGASPAASPSPSPAASPMPTPARSPSDHELAAQIYEAGRKSVKPVPVPVPKPVEHPKWRMNRQIEEEKLEKQKKVDAFKREEAAAVMKKLQQDKLRRDRQELLRRQQIRREEEQRVADEKRQADEARQRLGQHKTLSDRQRQQQDAQKKYSTWCKNCRGYGHQEAACPNPCGWCGETDHKRTWCPRNAD